MISANHTDPSGYCPYGGSAQWRCHGAHGLCNAPSET